MEFRIKEFINTFGNRIFLIQRRKNFLFFSWWGEASDWHTCKFYTLHEARNALSWIREDLESKGVNRKLSVKYHSEDK